MGNHLTWPNFSATIIREDEDRVHRVSEIPLAEIYHAGGRLGLQIERSADAPMDARLCRLLMLEVSEIPAGDRTLLRVTCARPSMFREAYLLFTAVTDRVLEEDEDPARALELELAALEALLDEQGVLSVEKQIGLFGELLVLQQFLLAGGPPMISCWTGPLGESHDFRLPGYEFEVKTATGRRRIHTINGLTQSVPSPGSALTFVSIQLAVAGAGEGSTLPGLIVQIEDLLAGNAAKSAAFASGLSGAGYRPMDAPAYARVWKLRSPMMLVPVDAAFPSLNPDLLIPAMGASYGRLEEISYKVNLDGAGVLAEEGLVTVIHTILNNEQ